MDNQQVIITCYNCGYLLHQSGKLCFGCGANNDQPVAVSQSQPLPKATQYVFQTTQQCDADNAEVSEVFSFPEVEITPTSLEHLLETYSSVLEQLRAEGCLFYSVMYNPKDGTSKMVQAGIPEQSALNINENLQIHFPPPANKRKRKQPVYDEVNALERKYACPERGCDYRTKYSWQVKNHMRQHTGEKPYCCNRCNFRTSDSSRLLKHTRAHDLVTPYRCSICALGFVKEHGLNCHLRLTHGIISPLTNTESRDNNNIRRSFQQTNGKWKCDICGKVSISRAAHVGHSRIHTGERPFACDKCAYRAAQKTSLVVHMKSHIDMESKSLACEHCKFRTDFYAILNHHNKLFHMKHNGSSETGGNLRTEIRQVRNLGPWKCTTCGIETSTRSQLYRHRKDKHSHQKTIPYIKVVDGEEGLQVFQCRRCKFSSRNEKETLDHSKKHTIRKYACDLCIYKTMSINNLNRHKRRLHGVIPVNRCSKCDFTSETLGELSTHKKQMHLLPAVQSLDKLKCLKCSFITSSEKLMKSHRNFHNGVSFICTICGFMFYDREELRIHQKLHDEKPIRRRKKKGIISANIVEKSGVGTKTLLLLRPIVGNSSKQIEQREMDLAGLPVMKQKVCVDASVINILKTLDSKTNIDETATAQMTVQNGAPFQQLKKKSMPRLVSLLNMQPKKTLNSAKFPPTEPTAAGADQKAGSNNGAELAVTEVITMESTNSIDMLPSTVGVTQASQLDINSAVQDIKSDETVSSGVKLKSLLNKVPTSLSSVDHLGENNESVKPSQIITNTSSTSSIVVTKLIKDLQAAHTKEKTEEDS